MSTKKRASVTSIGDAVGSNVEVNRDTARLRLNNGVYLPWGRSKCIVDWEDSDQGKIAGIRLSRGEAWREFKLYMRALGEKGLFKVRGFLAIFKRKLGNRD
jgi:hypothetical protein